MVRASRVGLIRRRPTVTYYSGDPVLRAVIGRLAFAHAHDWRINFDGGGLAGGVFLEAQLRQFETSEGVSSRL